MLRVYKKFKKKSKLGVRKKLMNIIYDCLVLDSLQSVFYTGNH